MLDEQIANKKKGINRLSQVGSMLITAQNMFHSFFIFFFFFSFFWVGLGEYVLVCKCRILIFMASSYQVQVELIGGRFEVSRV